MCGVIGGARGSSYEHKKKEKDSKKQDKDVCCRLYNAKVCKQQVNKD